MDTVVSTVIRWLRLRTDVDNVWGNSRQGLYIIRAEMIVSTTTFMWKSNPPLYASQFYNLRNDTRWTDAFNDEIEAIWNLPTRQYTTLPCCHRPQLLVLAVPFLSHSFIVFPNGISNALSFIPAPFHSALDMLSILCIRHINIFIYSDNLRDDHAWHA